MGMPRSDKRQLHRMQLFFYAALNDTGRAGFVILTQLPTLEQRARDPPQAHRRRRVDIIVSIGSNFFYTVTLPCTPGSTTKQTRN